MCVTLQCEDMFITLWQHGYVFHITMSNYVCHIAMTGLCSSNCDDMATFIVKLSSPHYDNRAMFIALWYLYMLVTLWQKGYVHHIVMSIKVRHIAMIVLCSSHSDICICSSHYEVNMFVMTWLCLTHCDNRDMLVILQCMFMFVTLRWQGYIHHIAMLLCLVDFNITMFDTFRCLEVFVTLRHRDMCVTLQCEEIFIGLQWRGDVWHIMMYFYVWHVAKLLSILWEYGYYHHNVTLLCSAYCNITMFIRL